MFWPMFTLVCWTLIILLRIAFKRLLPIARGQLSTEDFRVGESSRVPQDIQLANRNLVNLLEVPVLFYLAVLLSISAPLSSPLLLPLAWLYVALRIAHSLIHISYNHVIHRLIAFASSNLVLLVLWISIGLEMAGR